MKYNYKCVVAKNGKRYYKNIKGKWKRISNLSGIKAERGKRKYRINNSDIEKLQKELDIPSKTFTQSINSAKERMGDLQSREMRKGIEEIKRQLRENKIGTCNSCIGDIDNWFTGGKRGKKLPSQSTRSFDCSNCLKEIYYSIPTTFWEILHLSYNVFQSGEKNNEKARREMERLELRMKENENRIKSSENTIEGFRQIFDETEEEIKSGTLSGKIKQDKIDTMAKTFDEIKKNRKNIKEWEKQNEELLWIISDEQSKIK